MCMNGNSHPPCRHYCFMVSLHLFFFLQNPLYSLLNYGIFTVLRHKSYFWSHPSYLIAQAQKGKHSMRVAAVALVVIVGAAVVLWFGNTLNSLVLGGLIGGLAALL